MRSRPMVSVDVKQKNRFLNQIIHCCYSQVQPWVGLPFASVKVSRSLSLGSLINSNNIATGFDDAVFWLDFSIQWLLFQTEDLMDGKTTSRIIKHRFLHLQFSTVVKIQSILPMVRLNFITLAKMDNKAETEIQVWHVIEFSKNVVFLLVRNALVLEKFENFCRSWTSVKYQRSEWHEPSIFSCCQHCLYCFFNDGYFDTIFLDYCECVRPWITVMRVEVMMMNSGTKKK